MNAYADGTQGASVLVVDDEGANRYSVSKILQKVGYEVREAENGIRALELMGEHRFDVVLSDIRMPEMDGIELLKNIKEIDSDMIVILLTGYASLQTAIEGLRYGAHDYLMKPSSSRDLRASIESGVKRSQNLKRRRHLIDTIRNGVFELVTDNFATSADMWDEDSQDEIYAPSFYSPLQIDPSNDEVMQLGPFEVYVGQYQIGTDDNRIDLTPTEFDLLMYLAAHSGRVVACHELVREVRGYRVDETEAREVIRPHVSNLRRKLKETGEDNDIIINVRGIGYRLNDRVVSSMTQQAS